jgi:hypothetical protein
MPSEFSKEYVQQICDDRTVWALMIAWVTLVLYPLYLIRQLYTTSVRMLCHPSCGHAYQQSVMCYVWQRSWSVDEE